VPPAVATEERARTYHRWQFALSLGGFVLAALYLGAVLATGAAVALRNRLAALGAPWWLELLVCLVALSGAYRFMTLPLSWLSGFWLPRRFGLLHQPFLRWLWDAVKAALIGGALGLLGALLVYGLMRQTPWWWLWAGLVFFAGYALLTLVAPVWLAPLFYRLTPLGDKDLSDRLLLLAHRAGVPVLGVWIADQSRKSRTANAAVTGLGRTRRILLFDTLVAKFTPEETEAVLAHELAHHAHADIWRGFAVQGALSLATFWIADKALRAGSRALHLDAPWDPAGLPLFGLILMAVTVVALPLANGWSRHVERQADDFALRTASDPAAFLTALERLGELNLAERKPHPLKEFSLYSHPSIARRVARARARLGHGD
jgi:STE24 endopeptidase